MTLAELNTLSPPELKQALFNCCGSRAWVEKMFAEVPFADVENLLERAENIWFACTETDWLEAFEHHPKIGDINVLKSKYAATAAWAENEQSAVQQAPAKVLEELARENRRYEEIFGYIFIVCATGKSAPDMLALLRERMGNLPGAELKNAMVEQGKITRIRLIKLLTDE